MFHAGTTAGPVDQLVTAGGRVLGVTALGDTLEAARARAYTGVSHLSWPGMQARTDIAQIAAGGPEPASQRRSERREVVR